METKAGGGEDVRGNTDDAASAKDGAGADVPAGEEAAKAAAAEAARGRAIALTVLRPQERQALRRPPIPPPLPRSQAPKSPSPVPT